MFINLKRGQIIYIEGKKYVVTGMIEFQEDTWTWKEYEITDEHNKKEWLSIEEDENKQLEYCKYNNLNKRINTNELEFIHNDKKYTLYEKGTGKVTASFGDVDVDRNEVENYFEYMTEDEENVISVENWDGEIETSIGTYLDPIDVKITQEIEKKKVSPSYKKSTNHEGRSGIIWMIIVLTIMLIPNLNGLFINKSINRYIKKNPGKYTYVTSITSNTTKDKARVYKSKLLTVDSTVKDIIKGVPEAVDKVSESKEGLQVDGVGITTKNEYAYVYKEKNEVYVQVSNKKYVSSSGSTYHPGHRHHYYYGYSSGIRDSSYTAYANSARQESINARRSSGGGTSSGK